jgi:NADH:ubiquinone oxidoreductase subunit 3 (subunit A)
MPANYFPVLIFALFVLALPVAALLIFKFVRPPSPSDAAEPQLNESVICDEEGSVHPPYASRFYFAAVVSVIFSVATVFLLPWAIRYRAWLADHSGGAALIAVSFFLGILLVGYIWLYKKGALEWTR